MALTVDQLARALRADASDADVSAELTRLLAVAVAMAQREAPDAPEAIRDEAAVRIAGWLYDAETATTRRDVANALANSGARALLAPYRKHRAAAVAGAVAAAEEVGTMTGNPLVGVSISGDVLTFRFQDDTTTRITLPASGGGGGGLDMGAVDNRVGALVWDWAQSANQDVIPPGKLPAAATKAEAEAGTEAAARSWSPERVKEAILALASSLPSFAAGDIGNALRVQSDGEGGASVSWNPDPDVTEVAPLSALPAVAGYSVGDQINVAGAWWRLEAAAVDRHVYHGIISRTRAGSLVGDDVFEWEESPPNIRAHLSKDALGSSPPAKIVIRLVTDGDHGIYSESSISRSSTVNDTATTYGYLRTADDDGFVSDAQSAPAGAPFRVEFYSDDRLTVPVNVLPAGADKWVTDDADATTKRLLEPWATIGNAADIPIAKLQAQVEAWALRGFPSQIIPAARLPLFPSLTRLAFAPLSIAVANPTLDRRTPLGLTTSPAGLDLDDALRGQGVLTVRARLALTAPVVATTGFARDGANQETVVDLQATMFVGDVKGAAAYAASGAAAGVAVGDRTTIYKGAARGTIYGNARLYVARDGQNRLGVYLNYDGNPGTGTAEGFTLTATVVDAAFETQEAVSAGNPASWATAGSTERVPASKLPVVPGLHVIAHDFPGLTTVTGTMNDVRPAAATLVSPAFDLDDEDKDAGEFHAALALTIAPVSDVNMGFVKDGVNQTAADRRVDLSAIAFASAVKALDTWAHVSSGDFNGLTIFEQTVWSSTTEVGTYRLMLAKNAANQLLLYHYWEGEAGATNATITAELRLSFTPADAPAATSGGGAALSVQRIIDGKAFGAITGGTGTYTFTAAERKALFDAYDAGKRFMRVAAFGASETVAKDLLMLLVVESGTAPNRRFASAQNLYDFDSSGATFRVLDVGAHETNGVRVQVKQIGTGGSDYNWSASKIWVDVI